MAEQTPIPQKKWYEVFLPQLGGFFTALSVALVGILGAHFLNKKQDADTRAKVYAELTSQREQADTQMRKDMFAKIIESVLKKDESSDRAILNMELLAYNFHESLNLKPLFAYVQRNLDKPDPDKPDPKYVARLEKVARDVTRKQLLVLEEAGDSFDCTIDLNKLPATLESQSKTVGGITRSFQIGVQSADRGSHELEVRLFISTPPVPEAKEATFTVGPYDFPMIDNIRLSADQRCAVVLNKFDEGGSGTAEITVVCFPGSRASLREKTFSEDIIRNLENPRRD